MLTKMRKLNAGGFSLVELMVVVAIIGILSAVAIPNFQKFQRKARQSEAKALLGGIYSAEAAFKSEWESYYQDIHDIGAGASGILRYNAGFTAQADTAVANYTATATNWATIDDFCGANANECTGVATAIPAGATVTAADQFTAGAIGDIGGAVDDEWTITHLKVLSNTVSGL